MATSPFPAETGVGFSDAVLLAVSLLGFVMLAVTLYSLILSRLQSAEELDDGEEGMDYDEKLDRADVATLNRAQRRARAKNRMKKQRRIAPAPEANDQNGTERDQEEDTRQVLEETRHLSRKERQKAAKAAEREERRLYEDQRREMQRQKTEDAQRDRKEREQQEAKRAEEERLLREQEKKSKEQAEYDSWNTFLAISDGKSVSVQQFLSTLKTEKVLLIDEYADKVHVRSQHVIDRIRALQSSNRVTGVFDGRGRFIYITAHEMDAVASLIRDRGRATLKELATAAGEVVSTDHHVDN